MKFKKFVCSALIMSLASPALSYKSCPDYEIGHIFSDGNHVYIGRSADNLDGIITNTKADYQAMVSIALAARGSSEKVTVRYRDDAVNCDNPTWNAEIIGIGF